MMDGRPHARVDSRLADHKVRSPLELVARINEIFAKIHGYALLLAELEVNDCTVDKGSPRAASWCKIPVLASVLLHGIDSRACANVMFLDSDAYVETLSVSVDEYLRALEQRGDESLSTDSNWEVLFSSGSWFIPDDVCAGVLWLRGSSSAYLSLSSVSGTWPSSSREVRTLKRSTSATSAASASAEAPSTLLVVGASVCLHSTL